MDAQDGFTDSPPPPRQTPSRRQPVDAAQKHAAVGFWLAMAALVGLLAFTGLRFWSALHKPSPELIAPIGPKAEPPAWNPETPTDRLVDRFVQLHNENNPAAAELLAPDAAEGAVIPEGDVEPYTAAACLRAPLKIVRIYPGVPDASGKEQQPVVDHYTLATKGVVNTPKLRVRTPTGQVREGGSYSLLDPDVIVTVRGGKIHGVATAVAVR